jgi:hypothetical protein
MAKTNAPAELADPVVLPVGDVCQHDGVDGVDGGKGGSATLPSLSTGRSRPRASGGPGWTVLSRKQPSSAVPTTLWAP